MTSFGGKSIETKTNHQIYYPIQPAPCHSRFSDVPLRLENNERMRKDSYVNTRQVYPVPVVLLEKYDSKAAISFRRLTHKSLDTVRAACRHAPLRALKRRRAVTGATTQVLHVTSPPSSHRQVQLCAFALLLAILACGVYLGIAWCVQGIMTLIP